MIEIAFLSTVVVDFREDKNADTGHFELAYKQRMPSCHPYLGAALSLQGIRITTCEKKSNTNLDPKVSLVAKSPLVSFPDVINWKTFKKLRHLLEIWVAWIIRWYEKAIFDGTFDNIGLLSDKEEIVGAQQHRTGDRRFDRRTGDSARSRFVLLLQLGVSQAETVDSGDRASETVEDFDFRWKSWNRHEKYLGWHNVYQQDEVAR